jgi:hypothetical protein
VNNSKYSYGLKFVGGYQFRNRISIGLGSGIEFWNGYSLFPAFADIRYSHGKNRLSPVFSLASGYSFDFKGVDGGLFISPAVGIKRSGNKFFGYFINLGFRWQGHNVPSYYQATSNQPDGVLVREKVSLKFLTLSVGFIF